VGLIAGVELTADRASRRPFEPATKITARVAQRCLDLGLIVRSLPTGTTLAFSPPLCITRAEIDEVLHRFAKGLDAVADELTRQGEWKAA
jgi:adenosylmethionine-8-amino-7-oxononanoate aminotransferase